MHRANRNRAIAAACLALGASAVHAQDDPQILFSSPGPWRSNPISGAVIDLGLRTERASSPADLLAALRRQEWDLVIIRWFPPYPPDVYFEILDELTLHVDTGGALMFSIAELDRMPEYWPLLGIAGATDLSPPLSFIAGAQPETHPATSGMAPGDLVPDVDYGDELVLGPESFALNVYFDLGTPAIVMSNNGRVILNGQQWDQWDVASGIDVARAQIEWLLGCPADLDRDGDLTVFDFFEFQSRFDSGGASGFADFDYDGQLDVFDFLEFFNLFQAGCD
jgi:hypothetical protein